MYYIQTILSLNNAEIFAFFSELGISSRIHRRVIVSMIKKVLLDGTSDFGEMPISIATESVFDQMAAASRPTLHRMSSFSVQDVDLCVICQEEKSRGIFCNQPAHATEKHFTCMDCFPPYVRSICGDGGKFKDLSYSICCPNKTPALGCTSECWESHRITSALLAVSDVADSKATLDLYVSSLTSAAVRAEPVDDTTLVVAAIADAMCLRCPLASCKTLLDPRPDGCMAMRCAACGTHFCFLCLSIHEDRESCHAHVLRCGLNPNPGDYFTTPEKFDKVHRDLQIKAIKGVLSRRYEADESKWRNEDGLIIRSLENARRLLRGSNISIDSILPPVPSTFDGYFEGLDWKETVDGLKASVTNIPVLKRGFDRIFDLTMPPSAQVDNNRLEIGRNGGVELIIDAIKNFPDSEFIIIQNATKALCNLIATSNRNKDKLVSVGGCELIGEVLERYYRTNENITNFTTTTFAHLVVCESALERFIMMPSFISLLEKVVKRYSDSKTSTAELIKKWTNYTLSEIKLRA